MANSIRVTPEELKNAAQAFLDSNSVIATQTQNMLNIAAELQSTWGGSAATAYYNKLNGLESGITKMQKIIDKDASNLIEMGELYSTTEEQNIDRINALSKEDFV